MQPVYQIAGEHLPFLYVEIFLYASVLLYGSRINQTDTHILA